MFFDSSIYYINSKGFIYNKKIIGRNFILGLVCGHEQKENNENERDRKRQKNKYYLLVYDD